jgi:uncharacterized membrane protein YebE (DUF533 family)
LLDAEDILNGIVRGALSGRGKSWHRTGRAVRSSGLINTRTLLAAAGMAWGLFETWQGQQQQAAGGGGATGAAGAAPPSATPASTAPIGSATPQPGSVGSAAPQAASDPSAPAPDDAGVPGPVARLLRVMISAARADGELGPAERERILAEAREVGAEELVKAELDAPRPLGELVAGVTDPDLKQQLYTLAFVIVRADETVTGGERIYLAQLANRLGLDPATVARLESEAAARIDAAAAGPEPAR